MVRHKFAQLRIFRTSPELVIQLRCCDNEISANVHLS